MQQPIFQLLAELNNSQDGALPSDLAGAYVYVYLSTQDIKTAITTAEQNITNDGYDLEHITMACLLELSEFEVEDGHPGIAELRALPRSEDMLYSVFYGYEAPQIKH